MEREILTLTPDQARTLVWEGYYYTETSDKLEEFEIISDDVSSTSRWSYHHEIVLKRYSDNKYFTGTYSIGATEYQDEKPYQYKNTAVFKEVVPLEKVITYYGWPEND